MKDYLAHLPKEKSLFEVLEKNVEKVSDKVKEELQLVLKRNDMVKMMIFNAEIMRNLMSDLLDLAQMENSTFKLNKSYFSIFDVIDKAFSVVKHIAEKKNVRLIREDVPCEQ